MDDLIGSENGVYINYSGDQKEPTWQKTESRNRGKQSTLSYEMRNGTTKKYPPPIPLLARTGNLPGHMPWVLTREYIDGKLILREERVKHHEYFEAQRVNGRLLLNLVCLDDTVKCCHNFTEKLEEEEEEEEEVDLEGLDDDDDDDDYFVKEDEEKEEEEGLMAELSEEKKGSFSVPKYLRKQKRETENEELRKCFTYAGKKMISEMGWASCNVRAHQNSSTIMGQSGSAPLVIFAK